MLSDSDISLYIKYQPYAKYFKGISEVSRLNRSMLPHYKEFYVLLLNKEGQPGHWILLMRVRGGWIIFDSYGLPLDERIQTYIKTYDHHYRVENDREEIPFCSWNMNVEDIQSLDGKDSHQCGSWVLYVLDKIFAPGAGKHSPVLGAAPIRNFKVTVNMLNPNGGLDNYKKLVAHFA
jgi:hypothetical protein